MGKSPWNKEVMKLLFIAPSAYLLGGVQDWLHTTVDGLRKRGHDVQVGVPDGIFHNGKRYNEVFRGLNAEFIINKSGTGEGRIRAIEEFLEKRKADVIIGVNIGDVFEAIARKHKREKVRFAMALHAIEANYFADIAEYQSIIDGVVATNKLSEKLVTRISGLSQSKVYYAPYGIEIGGIDLGRRLQSDLIRICWVGRLEEKQKRVSDILKIIGYLDLIDTNYQLSIAGDGPHRINLEGSLASWVEKGKVRFYGMISKEELNDFYTNNDILLITSEWETGPIVAWEAINAGLNIVSSKYIGSQSEGTLIDQETALLFDIGGAAEAAEKIVMLRDQDLRIRLHTNALRVITSKYSIDASLDAWERAFEHINASAKCENISGPFKARPRRHSGKLEKYIGLNLSEVVRSILPKRPAFDAGSEWPHSLQEISEQTKVFESAKEIEQTN